MVTLDQVLDSALVPCDERVHLLLAVDQGVLEIKVRHIDVLCSRHLGDELLLKAALLLLKTGLSSQSYLEPLLTCLHNIVLSMHALGEDLKFSFFLSEFEIQAFHFILTLRLGFVDFLVCFFYALCQVNFLILYRRHMSLHLDFFSAHLLQVSLRLIKQRVICLQITLELLNLLLSIANTTDSHLSLAIHLGYA